MALVPFVGGSVVPGGLTTAQHRKAVKAVKKAVELHAQYGVPYATGGGKAAFMMAPLNEVRSGGRRRPAATQSVNKNVQLPPVAVGTTVTSRPASVGGRRFSVTHSALFGSITGASSFSVNKYRVNPGLPDLFPWLSGLAGSFDMYCVKSMEIKYVPVTGTDTEGAVYLAWDPDPLDPLPTTKGQVMNQGVSLTTPVWKPASLRVPSQGLKYIRRGEVLNASINTYDNGQLLVCQQSSASQLLGDLYVNYTIELTLPHVVANNASLYWQQALKKRTGSIAKATPLGTLPPTSYGDPICDVSQITYPASGQVKFPLANIVSYDTGLGSRVWRVLLDVYLAGTGMAIAVTCSDANAVVTSLEATTESTTKHSSRWAVTWTDVVPQASASVLLDLSGITTLTSISVILSSVPDSSTGVADT